MNMEAPEPVSMIQEIRTGGVGFEYALFRFGEEAKLAQVPRIYLADLSRMSSATLTLSVAPDSSDPHAQIVFIASVLDDRGARLPMLAKAEEGTLSADQTGFLCVDCGNETLKAKSLLLSLPLAARHLEGYFVNLAATGQAKVRADLESSITGAVKEKEESREPGKELMPFIGPVDSGTIDNSKVKLLHFNRTTRTTEIPLIFHDDVVPGTAKFDVRIAVQD
ncbi:MAG TPA: hypothetical protein VFM42_08760, partial [Sphingomicrobium sp.]|nr:hypothetical protein [Sphingomicrobium sp.]